MHSYILHLACELEISVSYTAFKRYGGSWKHISILQDPSLMLTFDPVFLNVFSKHVTGILLETKVHWHLIGSLVLLTVWIWGDIEKTNLTHPPRSKPLRC